MINFKTGQSVFITCNGHALAAQVLIASENGRSLMLGFDAALWTGDGLYCGSMPVLREDDGVYRELVLGHAVTIEPLPTPAQ